MIENPNLDFFPQIKELRINNISDDSVYIGVAGFEDRSLAFLSEWNKIGKKFQNVVGIKYLPEQKNNLIQDFTDIAIKASIKNEIAWIIYDRFNPENFSEVFQERINDIIPVGNVIIDISGMSKFLIVILLNELKKYPLNIDIIYSEAEIYHPTKEKYELEIEKFQKNVSPFFLTTNVYKIVTTTQLSSNSMQGYPLLIIAFPTFNYRDIFTLLNTLTPQYLIEIEGIPHDRKNKWRTNAIHKINERLSQDFQPSIEQIYCKKVSTFDYVETIKNMFECYSGDYKYTHKCIIAPTGSKLQTLGVFFFKQVYPDIHLVYPVTEHFLEDYTNGWKKIWHIKFDKFPDFIEKMKKIRKNSLNQLALKLENDDKKL